VSESQFSLWQPSSWWGARSVYPDLPLLGLSDDEIQLIETLRQNALRYRHWMELSEAYYLGIQVVKNLRIAIPKELEFINPILGWAAQAVDPYVARLHADGFRLAGATDVDDRLGEVMDLNGFAAEQRLAFTDALSMGRGYWMVGSPAERGDVPRITVESPLNMSVLWDGTGQVARAAMVEYWDNGKRRGSLVVPGKTVTLSQNDEGEWEIVDRDEHGFDFVPVVRMANRPRTHDRDGRSEISNALRYYIDNAARTMLGFEVSRDLYSVPKIALLGATEADFQNSDGTAKTAWETYATRVLALERDDEGNLPELKQLTAYDPSVFTKLLDWLASAASGEVHAPPQDMGLYTQGNPASAEAVQASNFRRDQHAAGMQPEFAEPLKRVAQLTMRFQNGGVLPKEFRRLDVDWAPITPPIPGITSDALFKEAKAGMVPPTSDVVLKRAGYSANDRARLEQDRKVDQGAQVLAELANSLVATEARVDTTVAKDINPTAAAAAPTKTPPVPVKPNGV
jgi:hypothetical protein